MDPIPLIGEGNKKTGSPEVPSAIVNYSDNYKGNTPTQGHNTFGVDRPPNKRLKLWQLQDWALEPDCLHSNLPPLLILSMFFQLSVPQYLRL